MDRLIKAKDASYKIQQVMSASNDHRFHLNCALLSTVTIYYFASAPPPTGSLLPDILGEAMVTRFFGRESSPESGGNETAEAVARAAIASAEELESERVEAVMPTRQWRIEGQESFVSMLAVRSLARRPLRRRE